MRELRFSRSIYAASAIDDAVASFERFATIERAEDEDGDCTVVRISATTPARERKVAGELGNFALGTTIRDLGAR